MRDAECLVAHEARCLLPGLTGQALPHASLQCAVAFDPAFGDHLPLCVVVRGRTVSGGGAPVLAQVQPRQLRMLVVGKEEDQRRVGIPFLDRLHLRIGGPLPADLAPRFHRAKGRNHGPDLAVGLDDVGVLFRRQAEIGLAREEMLPLGGDEYEGKRQRARPADGFFVIAHEALPRFIRQCCSCGRMGEPGQEEMTLLKEFDLSFRRPSRRQLVRACCPMGDKRQWPARGIPVRASRLRTDLGRDAFSGASVQTWAIPPRRKYHRRQSSTFHQVGNHANVLLRSCWPGGQDSLTKWPRRYECRTTKFENG